MGILVLNTGSSGLKFSLFDDRAREVAIEGEVAWRGRDRPAELLVRAPGQPERKSPCDAADPGAAASLAIRTVEESGEIAAIGHRVVHGGDRFTRSVRIDQAFESALGHLTELAPLHNPPALEAIAAAKAEAPALPQVAVFDTSFFADLPRSAAVYPTPWAWHEEFGIRRFGFHGISHAYCSEKAAEILGRDPSNLKLVVCHLGNGASAAGVANGHPSARPWGSPPWPA